MTERNYLLVQITSKTTTTHYLTLSEVASCCGVHPELIGRFVTLGLLDPVGRSADHELLFEAGAVPLLRKILRLRNQLGINYAGIGVVLELISRIEEMEAHIRELESRLFR
jgi:MerR family transcriptional regulator, heat shock protein HspR